MYEGNIFRIASAQKTDWKSYFFHFEIIPLLVCNELDKKIAVIPLHCSLNIENANGVPLDVALKSIYLKAIFLFRVLIFFLTVKTVSGFSVPINSDFSTCAGCIWSHQ